MKLGHKLLLAPVLTATVVLAGGPARLPVLSRARQRGEARSG